jgi:5'-nucleotidase
LSPPLLFLLSNDDGIDAPGLHVLAEAFQTLGEVVVSAPATEQSAKSHSFTMHEPLRVRHHGPGRHAVTGTPADSVYIGAHRLCPRRPDMVVSGINRGTNLGNDTLYSGTVAAAAEGALMGLPALAVSQEVREGSNDATRHWTAAAALAVQVAQRLLAHPLPDRCLLNLNVPDRALAEMLPMQTVRLGRRTYHTMVREERDPRGRPYYWIGGDHQEFCDEPDTDGHWFSRGHPTLTPLRPDLSARDLIHQVQRWAGP